MSRHSLSRLAGAAAAVLLAACADTAADTQGQADLLSLPVASTQARDASAFNARVAQAAAARETWPQDRLSVARAFVEGWGRSEVWRLEGQGESPGAYAVTVVFDGFTDDSVRGERHDFTLRREADETWRVADAKVSRRCWRGRHQQDYAADRCS
jgi:hypothetical protein